MFSSRLVIRDLPEPDLWELVAPLVWSDPTRGTLTVPQGFRTDLASIPRALRSRGKAFADSFLRDALIAEGASDAVADTYFEAVHIFGGPSWASDAPKEPACAA